MSASAGFLKSSWVGHFSPPLRAGVAATTTKCREASSDGADGVVLQFQTEFGLWFITTPSGRAEEAAQLFVDRAATPPRRGGETFALTPFGGSRSGETA
jgi:hypothetical protein